MFLATYGAVVDGDLLSWSIDGGPHIGIGGSHNNYEADASPVYSDLNQYGSNKDVVMSQFNTVCKVSAPVVRGLTHAALQHAARC